MRPNTTTTKTPAGTFLVFAIIFATVFLFAHGGFEHVLGTVTKVTPQSVTVATQDHKTVEVAVNAKTTYERGTQKVTAADLKVGDRVVIDATGEAPKLVAASVKIGAAAAAAASHDDHGDHAHK